MLSTGDRLGVLLAAGGASWESELLAVLAGDQIAVVKRCVDLADLLAAAGSGQADVAVVGADLSGLDAAAVTYLLRADVRTVAVGAEGLRSLRRIGVIDVVDVADLAQVPSVLRHVMSQDLVEDPDPDPGLSELVESAEPGRVFAVWGPLGSPGRTTVAAAVGVELARRRAGNGRVILADLDPYGGSLAQQLGVLDEASGLLAAARLVNAGNLDPRTFAQSRRRVGGGVELLTGLPRADRWIEVRDQVATEIIELARNAGDVVIDTGFCLEDSETDYARPGAGRNRMTLEALAAADEVLVVGSADPVGLTRLARGLVDLAEVVPGVAVRVLVNRMRDSLGWAEADIRGMVDGFSRPVGVHFLAEDRATADRALVAGSALTEADGNQAPLVRQLRALVDELFPDTASDLGSRRRSSRRRR